MASAACLPWAMALMIDSGPVTTSPPANTPFSPVAETPSPTIRRCRLAFTPGRPFTKSRTAAWPTAAMMLSAAPGG